MGRRAIIPLDHVKAQRYAAEALQTLAKAYDHVRFEAQQHEIEMVRFLVNTVYDPLIEDLELKRKCAMDVLAYARGKPEIRVEAKVEVPVAKEGEDQVSIDIQAVRVGLDRFRELSKWIGVVPEENWPPEIRKLVEEQEAAFAVQE